MRESAPWMTIWDDRILEYITIEGSGSASELKDSKHIKVSRSQISRRLKKLAAHGLLNHLGNGVYVITEDGEAYLNEELDASSLPEIGDGESGEGTASS